MGSSMSLRRITRKGTYWYQNISNCVIKHVIPIHLGPEATSLSKLEAELLPREDARLGPAVLDEDGHIAATQDVVASLCLCLPSAIVGFRAAIASSLHAVTSRRVRCREDVA